MFSFNTVVDNAVKQQKEVVKTLVRDQELAQAINKNIDAQAEMARGVTQATIDLSAKLAAETSKYMAEVATYDYTDAFQRGLKLWTPVTK